MEEAGKKITKLFEDRFRPEDKVAIKIHFGERGSKTYLSPILVKSVYDRLEEKVAKLALVDCNVLYKGERSFGTTHKKLALDNGFGFGEIIIADGEKGEKELLVEVNQKHFSKVKIGGALADFNCLLAVTHFTGHGGTGFGGALKNVGMGLGSKGGKLAMHQAFRLIIDPEICRGCFACQRECPGKAILEKEGKAKINYEKCLGCGICISVCPYGAVQVPFGAGSSEELQERIVEYALGALKGKKSFFVNVLLNITPMCDCFRGAVQKPMVADIGILVSNDIVAIDQASVDLVGLENLKQNVENPLVQIEYAQKLGLGQRSYQLKEID